MKQTTYTDTKIHVLHVVCKAVKLVEQMGVIPSCTIGVVAYTQFAFTTANQTALLWIDEYSKNDSSP